MKRGVGPAFLVLFITTMKLLTKEILQRFAKAGSQEDVFDALIICKFFDPCSSRTRYATEYDQARGIFFGYVVGEFPEW